MKIGILAILITYAFGAAAWSIKRHETDASMCTIKVTVTGLTTVLSNTNYLNSQHLFFTETAGTISDDTAQFGVSFLAKATSTTVLEAGTCQLSKTITETSWKLEDKVEADYDVNDWSISSAGANWVGVCHFKTTDIMEFIDVTDSTLVAT